MDFLSPFLIMKKYVYIIISVIIIVLITFYIGRSTGIKNKSDSIAKTTIKVIHKDTKKLDNKIDSLYNVIETLNKKNNSLKSREVVYRNNSSEYKIPIPNNKECDTLYKICNDKIFLLEQTIAVKDSIENNLNNSILTLDNVIINKNKIIENKDEEIGLLKSINNPRSKKLSISLQVGTGGQITTDKKNININRVPLYIGVGVSYKIFEF